MVKSAVHAAALLLISRIAHATLYIQDFMKNPVRNLIAVTAPKPETTTEAKAAVVALSRAKDAEGASVDKEGRVVFSVEWEPVFKEVKELSGKFKDATFTLYAEAFAKSHWVSKAVYVGGKAVEESTLSRIDGAAFRQVYQEIFGEAFSEKKLD